MKRTILAVALVLLLLGLLGCKDETPPSTSPKEMTHLPIDGPYGSKASFAISCSKSICRPDEPITITVTQNPNHFTFGKKMSYFNVRRGKELFSLHLSPTQKDADAIPTVTFSFDSAPFMVRKDKWTLTKPDPLEGKYKLYATWGFGGAYNSNVVEIEVIGE